MAYCVNVSKLSNLMHIHFDSLRFRVWYHSVPFCNAYHSLISSVKRFYWSDVFYMDSKRTTITQNTRWDMAKFVSLYSYIMSLRGLIINVVYLPTWFRDYFSGSGALYVSLLMIYLFRKDMAVWKRAPCHRATQIVEIKAIIAKWVGIIYSHDRQWIDHFAGIHRELITSVLRV